MCVIKKKVFFFRSRVNVLNLADLFLPNERNYFVKATEQMRISERKKSLGGGKFKH